MQYIKPFNLTESAWYRKSFIDKVEDEERGKYSINNLMKKVDKYHLNTSRAMTAYFVYRDNNKKKRDRYFDILIDSYHSMVVDLYRFTKSRNRNRYNNWFDEKLDYVYKKFDGIQMIDYYNRRNVRKMLDIEYMLNRINIILNSDANQRKLRFYNDTEEVNITQNTTGRRFIFKDRDSEIKEEEYPDIDPFHEEDWDEQDIVD